MPRVPYVPDQDLPDSYEIIREKTDELDEEVDADFWNRQPTVRAFSNNPELGEIHVTTNTVMWTETGLSAAESERIILAVARELDCELLWHDHVGLSVEDDRLSETAIRRIGERDLSQFDEKQRCLLEYTIEYVTEQGDVSDATHDALATHYDDEEVVSIVMLAGFYVSLSHEVKALGLTRDGFVGWHLERGRIEPP